MVLTEMQQIRLAFHWAYASPPTIRQWCVLFSPLNSTYGLVLEQVRVFPAVHPII